MGQATTTERRIVRKIETRVKTKGWTKIKYTNYEQSQF